MLGVGYRTPANFYAPIPNPSARDLHHGLQSTAIRCCLEGLAHLIERETMANQRRDAYDAILDELERSREVVRGEVMAAGKADLAIVDQIWVHGHLCWRVGASERIDP